MYFVIILLQIDKHFFIYVPKKKPLAGQKWRSIKAKAYSL